MGIFHQEEVKKKEVLLQQGDQELERHQFAQQQEDLQRSTVQTPAEKQTTMQSMIEAHINEEVTITETAQTQPHRFAQKNNMKDKDTVKRNEMIEKDPFGMLANCERLTASLSMKAVMGSLEKMEELMNMQVPSNRTEFQKAQTERVAAYNRILERCEKYLKAKNPWFASGKSRKRMVELIRNRCKTELEGFETASQSVFSRVKNGEAATWYEVLAELRTETINMDDEGREVTLGGEASSEVLICKIGSKKYYYKDSETYENIRALDFINQELQNIDTDASRHMYEVLSPDTEIYGNGVSGALENISMTNGWRGLEVNEENLQECKNRVISIDPTAKEYVDAACNTVEEMKTFLTMLRSMSKYCARRAMCELGGIKSGAVLSNYNVATSRMANLLGTPKLIAASKNVKLTYQGKERVGNMMDEAKGETYASICRAARGSKKKLKYSAKALSQLQSLLVLDYLCGQVDRNPGNFMCEVKKEQDAWTIEKITGIDNDMAFGEILLEKDAGLGTLPPFVEGKGECSIAALEPQFAANLASLTPEIVAYSLADIVGKDSLNTLKKRLKSLQKFVKENIKSGKIKLLDSSETNEWTEANEKKRFAYLIY